MPRREPRAGGGSGRRLLGPRPLAPIIEVLAAIGSVLIAVTKFMPGWATYTNVAVGVTTVLAATFSEMAQTSPTATATAILIAGVGAMVGLSSLRKRAEAW